LAPGGINLDTPSVNFRAWKLMINPNGHVAKQLGFMDRKNVFDCFYFHKQAFVD